MRSLQLSLFLLPLAALASPLQPADAKAQFCKTNSAVISNLKKQALATSYCSSYLSIVTKTSTCTKTVTPSKVYVTVPVTVTADAVTSTSTTTAITTTDVTTTIYDVSTITETSTDYTTTATSCYDPLPTLLKERGAPAPVKKPDCIPSKWSPPLVSTACSCLSLPTPTTTKTVTKTLVPITKTVTSTVVSTPTTTKVVSETVTRTNTITTTIASRTTTTVVTTETVTTISSSGLRYRKYTNPYNVNSGTFFGFNAAYFKTAVVEFSGVLQDLNFVTSGNNALQLPDRIAPFPVAEAAILAQGFFLARTAGVYTFVSPGNVIDNWGFLWIRTTAYAAWNDANTAYKAKREDLNNLVTGSIALELQAGEVLPITYLWANGGGPGNSVFRISTPEGDTYTSTVGWFAQACNANTFL